MVEITETGSTIKAHGLRIVEDLLYTHTVMVANKEALKDPWKRDKIERIALLLQSALAAREKVMLTMNVPSEKIDEIVKTLPALHAPTINRMYQDDWVSLETVVDVSSVRDLIPDLKAAGAQGILEMELRKIVS